ncbi:UDP-N-acetylglucosamine--LPS N-acetylglucosamine transferase [Paenarthrobacter sp. DKR-5]|uniref:UDP-N-acetylglucosamine--LPS N-acetylglucosamine transferase n=1 Tax=Paenarthrobacter sp. DKR-5 TaxID=2835535 RepID=UPI001BDD5E05|nr:UDP-N-acetylglucosamine--LPS N-acetylglucosamine transferase [Paenarthrobacter sp. DKR-5]MBT1002467.1 UDP-N-acetylglucosamine--LPS N-acetylglucosamine transferase [Paenarthrobacter sp. DKR-5]
MTTQLPAPGGERILLVGSSGGHLAQLLSLRPWWSRHERAWATFRTPDAEYALADEPDVSWVHSPTTRNVPNLLRNTALAAGLVRRFRPTVVVSTGAGSALPFFALGRLQEATTIYIEVFDRVESPTMTGRLCRPFTDLMCVQWEDQLGLYRDAHLVGRLL